MNGVRGWNVGQGETPAEKESKHKASKYNKTKKKEEGHLLNAGKAMARGKPRTAQWELEEAKKTRDQRR